MDVDPVIEILVTLIADLKSLGGFNGFTFLSKKEPARNANTQARNCNVHARRATNRTERC